MAVKLVEVGQLLTIPRVATLLGVTRQSVHHYINREGLPVVRLGRAVRVRPESLDAWLADREVTRWR